MNCIISFARFAPVCVPFCFLCLYGSVFLFFVHMNLKRLHQTSFYSQVRTVFSISLCFSSFRWLICWFSRQIQTSAKQLLKNATLTLRVITHTDHTCAHASLDMSEMDGIVQVQLIVLRNLWNLNSITCICLVVKSRYFFRFLKSSRDVAFHAAKSWHLSRGINLQQRKQIIHNY